MTRPLAIAHRGFSARIDENTILSCEAAIAAGADLIEADARFSADGTVFSLHDADLQRIADRADLVAACSDAALRAVRLWQGSPLATLAEIATAIDGRAGLLIDVKITNSAMLHALQALLATVPPPREVWLGIRSVDQMAEARALLPRCRIVGLIPLPEDAPSFLAAGVDAVRFWESELESPFWPEAARAVPVWATAGGRGTGRAAGDVDAGQLQPIFAANPAAVLLNDPTLITGEAAA